MDEYYYPGLWERVMENNENPYTEEGVQASVYQLLKANEDAVLVGPYHTMYYIAVSSGYCNWGFFKDRIFHENSVYAISKGSPFLPVFSEM